MVAKNELLDIVWPRLVVEENNLQVHISALLKLLGPDVIATIPGRGYRFTLALDDEVDTDTPPGAAAQQGPPSNLPLALPPLYGREAEVATLQALVQKQRLVTIVGAGGIGKTRVGLAVAQALHAQHPDGVWLVELAPLADEALVPASLAQVLKRQLRGVRALQDELVDALRSQQLLLVLDNGEHLLDAVGHLAQALLSHTPQVRLLVTSQEPLRLPAEQLFRLDTLGVPPPGADVATALGQGAVRLFVERVQAQDPRLVLDDEPAPQAAAWRSYIQGHWRLLRLRNIRGGAQALPLDTATLRALAIRCARPTRWPPGSAKAPRSTRTPSCAWPLSRHRAFRSLAGC